MNERLEIEVLACCPECGHSYKDWISFDLDCPFFVEDSGGKCKNIEEYHVGGKLGLKWYRYKFFSKSGKWKGKREHPNDKLTTLEEYNKKLEREIAFSKTLKKKVKLNRLKKATKMPERINVSTTIHKRNPDVITLVLERANGYCENCKKKAPFIRASDSSPYLETHHKVPLSKGGEDSIQNSQALCPNCHRKMHFGKS